MSIKISSKTTINEKQIKNYVLFCDENFKVFGLAKTSLNKHSSFINETINSNKLKSTKFLLFNLNSTQKIVLVKLKNNQSSTENEKNGADFYNFIKKNHLTSLSILQNNQKGSLTERNEFLIEFILSIKVR